MRSIVLPATEPDVWTQHLQEVFRSLEIEPGPVADNISASVAMYCREFHPHGVQRSDLVLLIARAFCAVNERAAAERVLGSIQPHSRYVERWLEILSELHHFPDMLPFFSQGIVRPADWSGAQLDRMWTLDFDRLLLSDAEKHEMTLYRSIRALVENMSAFWDASGGDGVLGLKGLASLNVEAETRARETLTATDDLLVYIADLFRQQQEQRCWGAVPALLNLDL